MAGCVLRSACRLVMQNHFYTYDNVIRKQTKGGAIGLKLTEKLGRFLMKRHDKKYKQLLKKLDIQQEIFDRYVDDETEGLAAIDPGVRFENGKLVRNEDEVEEDEEKAEDVDDGRTDNPFHRDPSENWLENWLWTDGQTD